MSIHRHSNLELLYCYIDKRMVRFIHNSKYSNKNNTRGNKTSSNIVRVKLLCVISTFSANYQYLSFRYGLTEADWYINIDHLMGKVRKKCLYCIQSLFYVMY